MNSNPSDLMDYCSWAQKETDFAESAGASTVHKFSILWLIYPDGHAPGDALSRLPLWAPLFITNGCSLMWAYSKYGPKSTPPSKWEPGRRNKSLTNQTYRHSPDKKKLYSSDINEGKAGRKVLFFLFFF